MREAGDISEFPVNRRKPDICDFVYLLSSFEHTSDHRGGDLPCPPALIFASMPATASSPLKRDRKLSHALWSPFISFSLSKASLLVLLDHPEIVFFLKPLVSGKTALALRALALLRFTLPSSTLLVSITLVSGASHTGQRSGSLQHYI